MQLDGMTAAGAAFELPVPFSVLAHFTFGVTGALAGIRRGYDIIGVAFVATVTAIGGGLLRDGLLISRGPPSILTEDYILFVVFGAAALTLVLYPLFSRLSRTIAVVDALGLGAFAVFGVQRSLNAGLNAPAAVVGGTLTAVGGGLLRDILVREEPLLFKPGQFYALVAIFGCCLYLWLPMLKWAHPERAAQITIAAVFVIRLLAIKFNWQTRPLKLPTPPA